MGEKFKSGTRAAKQKTDHRGVSIKKMGQGSLTSAGTAIGGNKG